MLCLCFVLSDPVDQVEDTSNLLGNDLLYLQVIFCVLIFYHHRPTFFVFLNNDFYVSRSILAFSLGPRQKVRSVVCVGWGGL